MLTKTQARALAVTLVETTIPKRQLRERFARDAADELATQMVLRLAELLRAAWNRFEEQRGALMREHKGKKQRSVRRR